jgi:endonuclease/exonuclease/phosphatase family metal-dependent hydrolase
MRVVTLNLWGEQPPVQRRMAGVIDELHRLHADVIALQEVRQIPSVLPNQAETLAGALGMQHAYAAATPWGGGDEGLAILSRHPILSHTAVELPDATAEERRIVLIATLGTPAGTLAVGTTHLTYRLHDGEKRARQIVAAEAALAATPSELPRLLCGDLNAPPDADEIRWLRGLCALEGRRVFWQDAWGLIHPSEPGWTWALRNPHTERLSWLTRDRRIDYIFVGAARKDGTGTVRDCRLCFDIADEEGCHPSDHFGLVADVDYHAPRAT